MGEFSKEFSGEFQEDKIEIIVKCTDNCSCMSVDKWVDDPEYFITFYKTHNKSFWYRIKEAFKYIFGKDIIGTELVLDEKEFDKLRNF